MIMISSSTNPFQMILRSLIDIYRKIMTLVADVEFPLFYDTIEKNYISLNKSLDPNALAFSNFRSFKNKNKNFNSQKSS